MGGKFSLLYVSVMNEFSLCRWDSCKQRMAHCREYSSLQPTHWPQGSLIGCLRMQRGLLMSKTMPPSVALYACRGLKQGIRDGGRLVVFYLGDSLGGFPSQCVRSVFLPCGG